MSSPYTSYQQQAVIEAFKDVDKDGLSKLCQCTMETLDNIVHGRIMLTGKKAARVSEKYGISLKILRPDWFA